MRFQQISGLLSNLNEAQKAAFLKGLRDSAAPTVAIATWAFVTGIAMVKSGLTEGMSVLMTFAVYAGSAQLTALPLIEAGAPLWLIFAAGMVVNVRFIIFGAALQPYFRHLSKWRLGLIGFLTSDIGFVLFMSRYSTAKKIGTNQQVWYFLGIILPGWLVWCTLSIVGIYLGGMVPQSWSLDFAAVLALMAIIVPLIKGRPLVMCLVVAGAVAWVSQVLPLRLGLVAAVLAGVVAGLVSEKIEAKSKSSA